MSKQLSAYIAGPLFNEHERWFLERINEVCEGIGLKTFLPHRDTHFESEADTLGIFNTDVRGILDKDIMVALLDGQDIDSGTCVELGIAHMMEIAVIGITTDTIRRAYANAMPYGVCMSSLGVVHSIDELKIELACWLSENINKA